jgi:hypothetical protein
MCDALTGRIGIITTGLDRAWAPAGAVSLLVKSEMAPVSFVDAFSTVNRIPHHLKTL